MNEQGLHRLFLGIISTSLLGAACSSGDQTAPVLQGFTMPVCRNGFPNVAAALRLAFDADYIAIRGGEQTFSEFGSPCAGADDVTSCRAALDAVVLSAGPQHWSQCSQAGCTPYGLLTTAGNTVALAQSDADLRAALATIDTEAEAIILALADGYDVPCGREGASGARAVDGGFEVVASRLVSDCAPIVTRGYVLHVTPEGAVSETQSWERSRQNNACIGRRPRGLVASASQSSSAIGDYFAETAQLEAASVDAFVRLADELRRLGAPADLVDDALSAAGDEVRHAQVTARLARRFGARPALPQIAPLPPGDLERVALENTVEGCVRETFGAMVATYQAYRASDTEIASELQHIAEDETRHATLSFRIAAWADTRLDSAARQRIRTAQRKAIASLRSEVNAPIPPALEQLAGIPNAALARSWVDRLEAQLWS